MESIRVRSGMKDATLADPIDLKIEDIISLPIANSKSSLASKGIAGLQYKDSLENLIKPSLKGKPERQRQMQKFFDILYDSRIDLEPWVQENEIINSHQSEFTPQYIT